MSATPEPSPAERLSLLYCPDAQAHVLQALFGIEHEIRAGLTQPLEHQVAHVRLNWWREECERVVAGHPLHPLTRALLEQLPGPARASLAPLAGLIDLAGWDLAQAPFDTDAEHAGYCRKWSLAVVGPCAALAAGGPAPGAALDFGAQLQSLLLLVRLNADARAGRIRVPLQALAAAGIPVEQLAARAASDALAAWLKERHAAARAGLAAATAALGPALLPPLRGLAVLGVLAQSRSRRVSAALPDTPDPGEDLAALDAWRAWRAARRAARGTAPLMPS
ncbi:MAG: squalene/phytoene synthase family protein [Proteobacteria bacterium]|nr:squalene/phytoene synthase family protein [Pseudomonadota bacterium]